MTREVVVLLGIERPIVQAPIGNAATPALAAAISQNTNILILISSRSSNDQFPFCLDSQPEFFVRPHER